MIGPKRTWRSALGLTVATWGAGHAIAGPTPVGSSTITVSYPTGSGVASFSGDRNYRGAYFPDATPLGSAPNIKVFSAVDVYGRRVKRRHSIPAGDCRN